MISKVLSAFAILVFPLALTGCESTAEFFSNSGAWIGPDKKDKKDKKKDKDESPLDPVKDPKSEKSPLEVRAFANGPVIQFSIRNSGSRDIPLSREDFALVVPGGRRLIRYDSFVTNLEINPWPEVLRPGQAVTGRAIFHEISDPVAYRLIVNPRTGLKTDAAFAVISIPGTQNLLDSARRVDTEPTP